MKPHEYDGPIMGDVFLCDSMMMAQKCGNTQ
jgi:hypothetical protein